MMTSPFTIFLLLSVLQRAQGRHLATNEVMTDLAAPTDQFDNDDRPFSHLILLEDVLDDDGDFTGPTRLLLQSGGGSFLGCPRNQRQCPSGLPECMVAVAKLPFPLNLQGEDGECNGIQECSDGSDEDPRRCAGRCTCPPCYKCPFPSCHAKCPSGICTNHTIQGYTKTNTLGGATPCYCDGVPDCADGSDEEASFCAKYNCANSVAKTSYGDVLDFTTCPGGSYCILKRSLCDGSQQCPDGSDESADFCKAIDCTANGGRIECPGGRGCVFGDPDLCNGIKSCPDGSDEDPQFCKARDTCPYPNQVKCPSGAGCLYDYAICDARKDCLDGSDEDVAFCKSYSCPGSKVKCPGGGGCMYSVGALCDGTVDCTDGSDEGVQYCSSFVCPNGASKCPSGAGCLRGGTQALCNGFQDCLDNSDEQNCSPANCTSTSDSSRVWCEKAKICGYGRPCDGVADCPGGTDEDPATCAQIGCPARGDLRKCPGGSGCIQNSKFCDGVKDCSDGSDEQPELCKNVNCRKCPSGVGCLPSQFQICDGVIDCIDGSDEKSCTADMCQPKSNSIFCSYSKECVSGFYCDGNVDCLDGTDEDPAICKTQQCPTVYNSQYLKCSDGTCLAPDKFCDGTKDCPDGSDESADTCKSFDCSKGAKVKCPGSDFCISDTFNCDGKSDCPDGSDESADFCQAYDCSKTHMNKCPSGKQCSFSDPKYFCDGYSDCPDKSDEDVSFCSNLNCDEYSRQRCPGKGCLPFSSGGNPNEGLCDGYATCPDRSDEDPSFCKAFDCASASNPGQPPRVKCPGNNTQCVLGTLLCSGYPGACLDGSDNTPQACKNVDCVALAGPDFISCPNLKTCVQGKYCDGNFNCPDASDESPARCGGGPPVPSPAEPPNSSPDSNPTPTPSSNPAPSAGPGPSPSSNSNPDPNPSPSPSPNPNTNPNIAGGPAPTTEQTGAPPAGAVVPPSTPCPPLNDTPTNSCFNKDGTLHVCCITPDSCGAFFPSGDATCTNGNYFVFSTPGGAAPVPQPPQTFKLLPAGTPCPVCKGSPSNSCFNANGDFHVCCVNPSSCATTTPTCDDVSSYVEFTGSPQNPVAVNC